MVANDSRGTGRGDGRFAGTQRAGDKAARGTCWAGGVRRGQGRSRYPLQNNGKIDQMSDIPILTTPRLTLRPMRATDWDEYLLLMSSDRAVYMGGPFSTEVAWGMFCADHAQWDLYGVGALMIENRLTGACLGQVGINAGPLFPERELGWFLYPLAQGYGFAQEAATAMRDWGQAVMHLETLVSYIDSDNARSAKLAERLGARLDETAARPDPADLVYRHFGKSPLPPPP